MHNAKKRARNEEEWKANKRKNLRNSGREYISESGKLQSARQMKEPCTNYCRLKCSENIKQSYRQQIFDNFWKLGSYQRQRDYLNGLVDRANSTKNRYNFVINRDRLQVCRTFFINTLGISINTITWLLKKRDNLNGMLTLPDQRGKVNHYKIPEQNKNIARNFLRSLPRLGSTTNTTTTAGNNNNTNIHSGNNIEYIDIKKYRSVSELYKYYCDVVEDSIRVSESMFRNIFKNDFNLNFK